MQPDRRTRLRHLLRGVASIPDLFATRAPSVPRHRDGVAADREAIAGDWQHLGQQLEAHADRDGLTGVRRAVFLDRGGHAQGDACPSEPAREPDPHAYWCGAPDEPCRCGVED